MQRTKKDRIHISWVIAWISIGFLLGVALSVFPWGNDFASTPWLIVSLSLIAIVIFKKSKAFIAVALGGGIIFGLYFGGLEQQELDKYHPYYGKVITISAKVAEDTSYGPRGDQRIRLNDVRIYNTNLPGEIWVSTSSNNDIKRGDIIILNGFLDEGFGNIPASVFRAEILNIERPYPGDVARRIRDRFAEGIRISIPEPEASLGIGYLVGQRTTLPETLDQQIKTVGLTHAIVASGYNLTILVAFSSRLLLKKSKYLAAVSGLFMIGAFILITGLSPSMSRAGLVSVLGLVAWYYGRQMHPLVLLPFAAAVTVLIRPSYVWGDIGWYLSFTAFVGIIILSPLIQHYFWGLAKKPKMLRQLLIDTVAAQIVTAPIILFVFHQYSVYALPANLLVLPLVPITMLLTFISGLLGLIIPGIGQVVGALTTIILEYMIKVIGFIANFPGAKSEIIFNTEALFISYVILTLIIIFLWRSTKHNFRSKN